jgi:hypothetical protein
MHMPGGYGNTKTAVSYWRVRADARPIKATTKDIAMHIGTLHSDPETCGYRIYVTETKSPYQGSGIISVSLICGGGCGGDGVGSG